MNDDEWNAVRRVIQENADENGMVVAVYGDSRSEGEDRTGSAEFAQPSADEDVELGTGTHEAAPLANPVNNVSGTYLFEIFTRQSTYSIIPFAT